jgi:hypothetical protein
LASACHPASEYQNVEPGYESGLNSLHLDRGTGITSYTLMGLDYDFSVVVKRRTPEREPTDPESFRSQGRRRLLGILENLYIQGLADYNPNERQTKHGGGCPGNSYANRPTFSV